MLVAKSFERTINVNDSSITNNDITGTGYGSLASPEFVSSPSNGKILRRQEDVPMDLLNSR